MSTWNERMAQWEIASAALIAKHQRLQHLALARCEANWRYDLQGFFARLRVRFNRELERIPAP